MRAPRGFSVGSMDVWNGEKRKNTIGPGGCEGRGDNRGGGEGEERGGRREEGGGVKANSRA